MQNLRYSRYFKTMVIFSDIMIISIVFAFFLYPLSTDKHFFTILITNIFWLLLSGRTKLYSIPRSLTYTRYLERIFTHILLFIISLFLLSKISDNQNLTQNKWEIFSLLFFILLICKSGIFFILKYIRAKGINHRNVMFLVETPSTEILREIFQKRKDYGYKIFDYPQQEISIDYLRNFWKSNGIHTLFLPSQGVFSPIFEKQIFEEAEKNGVQITLLPNIISTRFFAYDLGYIESLPVLSPAKFPLDYFTNSLIKRIFDILFSLIVLLGICSWLFPIIAIFIKWESKGGVFFTQKRYGYKDEVFDCYKFRTMVENQECSQKITEENDKRITKIGKILRKTSLDELPQFINVLLGQMSVVGPRPHMLSVDEEFKPKIGRYVVRSLVKPGITGLAQVNGLRGDKGNRHLQMKKRIIADSFYVKNWSLSLDFIIILKTLVLMLKGDENAF